MRKLQQYSRDWLLIDDLLPLTWLVEPGSWSGTEATTKLFWFIPYERDKDIAAVMLFKSIVGSACTLLGAATAFKFGMSVRVYT